MGNFGDLRWRMRTLRDFERLVEWPMLALALAWLLLLVLELTTGMGPILQMLGTTLWVIFILEAAIRLYLAPRKLRFVRRNWLTLVALALPALRLFRIFRALRFVGRMPRGVGIVQIVGSINRGMLSLGRILGRRGFGYVAVLTLFVVFAGAAGMQAFEGAAGFRTYGESLWWTAMLVTTVATGDWPVTSEGRILALMLSLYALGVFGYIAATLASIFIEQDAGAEESPTADKRGIESLRAEIAALRAEIRSGVAGR
jgi:voltage-gated potassium channel